MSLAVFLVTRNQADKILLHPVISGILNLVSLVMSIVWIYLLATELVGLLETIGAVC